MAFVDTAYEIMAAQRVRRSQRRAYWRVIEERCHWTVSDYCGKRYDFNKVLVGCNPSNCPLVDEAIRKDGTDEG
jgi:hypothetical protein